MAYKLLWIFLAGGLGAASRFGLSLFIGRITDFNLPIATFLVNIIGTFLFGVIWSLFESHMHLNQELRVIILVGFMGAFTTFSTFMFEIYEMLKTGQYLYAAANLTAHIILGILFMFIGIYIGTALGTALSRS